MFDPTREVPSFELCKKLKEAGFPQEGGGWYWNDSDPQKPFIMFIEDFEDFAPLYGKDEFYIKAPTPSEVAEWFPGKVEKNGVVYMFFLEIEEINGKKVYNAGYGCHDTWHKSLAIISAFTLANCFGGLWLWLEKKRVS